MQQAIARSRIKIEQARLLMLRTTEWLDSAGHHGAWRDVSITKVTVPRDGVARR
jgi:acyl-CoA dehydrogenase